LTIGIFPYISKLLQAAGQDLRPVLIFIWARILAVDQTVQADLFNSSGFKYFSTVLGLKNDDVLPNSSEHKAMCSFILAAVSRDFPHGQAACWAERVFDNCYDRLEEPDFLLRQWTALCIAQIWSGNDEIKVYGVDHGTQDKLIRMLSDDSAEVRSAALYALGTFMGASGSADLTKPGGGGTGTMHQLEERVHFRMEVAVATGATLAIKDDASPMCRKELLVVISCLVKEWRGYFVVCAWLYWEEDRRWRAGVAANNSTTSYIYDDDMTNQAVAEWLDSFSDDEMLKEENRVLLSSFFTIFVVLLDLSVDPYAEVATMAQTIVDYIMALLLESPFTKLESSTLDKPPSLSKSSTFAPATASSSGFTTSTLTTSSGSNISDRSRIQSFSIHQPQSTTAVIAPPSPKIETTTVPNPFTNPLKRTSSLANATSSFIKSFAFPSASTEDGRLTPTTTTVTSGLPITFQQYQYQQQEFIDLTRAPPPNLNFAVYESPYAVPPPTSINLLSTFDADRYSSPPSSRSSTITRDISQQQQQQQRTYDFQPYHVMEALMEEDMERLRARRKVGMYPRRNHQHHSHHRHHGTNSISSPSNSTFSRDSGDSGGSGGGSASSGVILGLGTGAGIKDVLPLRSTFYDWCCEYFKEPQMRVSLFFCL
jgi:regulator-associated protein of mTOR